MSFLGNRDLELLIEREKCIIPFEEKNIKSGAYELSLGEEVYLTDSKTEKVERLNKKNRQIDINPGQCFAFDFGKN